MVLIVDAFKKLTISNIHLMKLFSRGKSLEKVSQTRKSQKIRENVIYKNKIKIQKRFVLLSQDDFPLDYFRHLNKRINLH